MIGIKNFVMVNRSFAVTVSLVVIASLVIVLAAQAATTISTNVDTDGNLVVDGNSTLGDAVGDLITANGYFTQVRIGTDSTFGHIGTVGADELGVEGDVEIDGTLWVDGIFQASSTALFGAGVTLGDAVGDAITATGYFTQVRVGTGTTFNGIGAVGADELGVEGDAEIDGTLYADGNVSFGGNATTTAASGDITTVGKLGVGTSSPSFEAGIQSTGTTTLYIHSSTAARGGCVQIESAVDTVFRFYATTTGPIILESGSCE